MRLLSFFILIISIPAFASPPRPIGMSPCLPYVPSATEVTEMLAASSSSIPKAATLSDACSYTWAQLTPPTDMKETRHYNFYFNWPLNSRIDYLWFYARGSCHRKESEKSRCHVLGPMARIGDGELFSFGESISELELKELIDRFQEFPVPEAQIVSVSKTYDGHSGTWRIGKRIYRIVVAQGGDRFIYTIQRRCKNYSECAWHIELLGKLAQQAST